MLRQNHSATAQGTEAARPVRITDVSAAVGKPNPAFVYWLAA
jgi:hypothetical protein